LGHKTEKDKRNISDSVITRVIIDQAGCVENTQALPQRVKARSVSGSALLSYGEELCPLRLQTVFSTLSLIFPEIPPELYPSQRWRYFHG
jgi:hypothetical protein